MKILKRTIAAATAALILASCGGPPPRPTINNDLDALRWGTRDQKKRVIVRDFTRKDPSNFIKLLDVTATEVVQTRVKPDTYWYDNRAEQVWTIRFIVNVLAQRLKSKKAFPAILNITACPFYKDGDGLAKWLEKAMISLGDVSRIDAMVAKASTPGLAPSHLGAILQAAGVLVKNSGRKVPASLAASLEKLLGSSDPAVLKQGIRLAGTLKHKPAESLIVKQLSSTDKGIRRAAATALVRLGNPKGIAPLLEMSRSNPTLLNNTIDMIEKAGFADEARLWTARQQGKDIDSQTDYLKKMGMFN